MTRRFCNRLQGRCLRVAENDAHIYIGDIPLIIKTGLSWSKSQNHFDKNIFATDCQEVNMEPLKAFSAG